MKINSKLRIFNEILLLDMQSGMGFLDRDLKKL